MGAFSSTLKRYPPSFFFFSLLNCPTGIINIYIHVYVVGGVGWLTECPTLCRYGYIHTAELKYTYIYLASLNSS